ncbi:MAG: hypothetical protein GY820_12515 [Gammaproteobacteria bacterium]|nr:hypothetical protein [Gammaproteobacteria bacterium]
MSNFSMDLLPKYSANWHCVYFKPMPNSDEKLTVAIAIRGMDGIILVEPLLSQKRLNDMFGKSSKAIFSKIDLCVKSARATLEQRITLSNWMAPLTDFEISVGREALSESIEGVYRQAVLMSTSFGASLVEEQSEIIEETDRDINHWVRSIKKSVKLRHEKIGNLFGREIFLKSGKIKEKIGFLSATYGADFGKLNPSVKAHLGTRRAAQSKLWQLDQIRDSKRIDSPKIVELIIGHPNSSSLDSGEMNRLQDNIQELKIEANSRDIKLFSTDSSERVADHILSRATA